MLSAVRSGANTRGYDLCVRSIENLLFTISGRKHQIKKQQNTTEYRQDNTYCLRQHLAN